MTDPDFKELYYNSQEEILRLTKLLEEALSGNKDLQEQLKQLQDQLDKVLHQLEKKNKREYGKKTERHNPRPAQSSDKKVKKEEFPKPPVPDNAQQPKPPSPAGIELKPEPVEHKVDASASICPNCHAETSFLSTHVSYQLERIVGALKKLEHRQELRSCQRCKTYVVTAEKPMAPIPGGKAGPGLLAFIIVSKFLDGLPLYRIQKILHREGEWIPRSTLSDWAVSAAFTLEPLYDAMKRELLCSKIVRTDDSPLKIQDRKHKNKIRTGKQTTYIGDENHPLILFDFSRNQSFDNNKAFLKDFKGLVQADAHKGFDALFHDGSKVEIGCSAHARRKFFECPDSSVTAVEEILDVYTELYQIEARIAHLPAGEKLAWRRRCSKPLTKRLHSILLKVRASIPPKEPLRQAADYTLNNWFALTRFLKDADIDLDNNASERAIKDFVIMRKNALFVGSDEAGKAAAIHLSMVASAKRNGIDPVAYMTDVLSHINTLRRSELEQFLPHRWAEARKGTNVASSRLC